MGTPGIYLFKSVVWLVGFALVFLIFLRNERYFGLNRIYLLSGIIASIAFPFWTMHYTVFVPSESTLSNTILDLSQSENPKQILESQVFWWLYAAGIGMLTIRLIWQTVKISQKLRQKGYELKGSVKLVRTDAYAASFSFFSYIFVNPSISETETKEILNHEREHIKQKHWLDLLLAEILCMLQWFNPLVWIYAHLIRQNHEFLADQSALQHSASPAQYKAILLNQLIGAPIIRLANSFNYSLNKRRFNMMKKSMHSPIRKIKLLLILPLVALIFYAFAEPDYKTNSAEVRLNEKANSVNSLPDEKRDREIEPAIFKSVTDTFSHSSINENRKSLINSRLTASDSVQSVSEKRQKKSLQTKTIKGDSVSSGKSDNQTFYVGYPSTSHLKSSGNLGGYPTVTGSPIAPLGFPGKKQLKFGYKNDLTLVHDMSGNTLLKSIGVGHIKLDIPKKPFGMKVGYPSNIMVNDSTLKKH